MIGGALRYYRLPGDGQTGRGLGGVLRNSLAKIQPTLQRVSDMATQAVVRVGKRKALGALGDALGVRLVKKKKKKHQLDVADNAEAVSWPVDEDVVKTRTFSVTEEHEPI